VTQDCSILAVVGDGMAGLPGVAGRFFGTLGQCRHQRARDRPGCLGAQHLGVIDTADSTRALRAVHSSFYLSKKTISIGVIGPGTVGAVLLRPDRRRAARLAREFKPRPARSGDRHVEAHGAGRAHGGPGRLAALLEAAARRWTWTGFAAHVQADHLPHAVIIDCTASGGGGGRYATGWRRSASTSSRRTRRRNSAAGRTTTRCAPHAARAQHALSCTRPPSAPGCR
jgi:bifunctional aspartokinase / homoserine dehydrogenase 1